MKRNLLKIILPKVSTPEVLHRNMKKLSRTPSMSIINWDIMTRRRGTCRWTNRTLLLRDHHIDLQRIRRSRSRRKPPFVSNNGLPSSCGIVDALMLILLKSPYCSKLFSKLHFVFKKLIWKKWYNNSKNYSVYNTYVNDGERAAGGSTILVRDNILHSCVNLNTDLQVVAVRISLGKAIFLCSVYIPPNSSFCVAQLKNVADQ